MQEPKKETTTAAEKAAKQIASLKAQVADFKQKYAELESMARQLEADRENWKKAYHAANAKQNATMDRLFKALDIKTAFLEQGTPWCKKTYEEVIKDFLAHQLIEPIYIQRN